LLREQRTLENQSADPVAGEAFQNGGRFGDQAEVAACVSHVTIAPEGVWQMLVEAGREAVVLGKGC
jgi:hypothetical protein